LDAQPNYKDVGKFDISSLQRVYAIYNSQKFKENNNHTIPSLLFMVLNMAF